MISWDCLVVENIAKNNSPNLKLFYLIIINSYDVIRTSQLTISMTVSGAKVGFYVNLFTKVFVKFISLTYPGRNYRF